MIVIKILLFPWGLGFGVWGLGRRARRAAPEEGVDLGELEARVDAEDLVRVVHRDRHDSDAVADGVPEDVRQVELLLGVVVRQARQLALEDGAVEDVDPRVDLADRALFRRRVLRLDDPGEPAVSVADNAAVGAGVGLLAICAWIGPLLIHSLSMASKSASRKNRCSDSLSTGVAPEIAERGFFKSVGE